jgi:hypothetical protein
MRLSAAVLLALVAGCSKDSSSTSSTGNRSRTASRAKTNDSAAGSVDLAGPAYKPSPLTAIGSVSGTIRLEGPVPPALAGGTAIPAADQKACGTQVEPAIDSTPKGVADVIVWIADARTGKALPTDKRQQLSSEKCLLDPRVQTMIVGSTVNVFNDDKALHKLAFIEASSGDTLEKMPFFNEGQVVASERLAKNAGIVEVRCQQHPWSRAYIAVFDQPYYAVTEKDGAFRIDSLPPGKYTLNVWHEGMKQPASQTVQIDANGSAKVDLAIKLQ